jgi:hypothetical protein
VARPALMRRLNPDAAIMVSFMVRLAPVIVMGFVALSVLGLAPGRSPWAGPSPP